MGAALSDDGYSAQAQQQQRAQLLLLSQLREARAQEAGVAPGPGIQPTERPGLRKAQVYKNPLHIHGRTIQLERRPPSQEGGHERWDLSLSFDAAVPCELLLSLGVQEGQNKWPPPGATWTCSAASFGDGLGQSFRVEVDYDSLTTPLRLAAACGGDAPPFVGFSLELRERGTEGDGRLPGNGESAVEYTLGRFTQRLSGCGAPEVEVRSQHVQLPGAGMASSYEMREVFGAESHGPAVLGQDCVICMSERRDTAVLPCRHMCLCGSCAETMRSRVQYRSYRCPICRERVSSLLQIGQEPPEPLPTRASQGTPAPPLSAPTMPTMAMAGEGA